MKHLLKGAEDRTEQFGKSGKKPSFPAVWRKSREIFGRQSLRSMLFLSAVAVYLNQNSHFYKSDELYDAVNLALDFVARTQREDGGVLIIHLVILS